MLFYILGCNSQCRTQEPEPQCFRATTRPVFSGVPIHPARLVNPTVSGPQRHTVSSDEKSHFSPGTGHLLRKEKRGNTAARHALHFKLTTAEMLSDFCGFTVITTMLNILFLGKTQEHTAVDVNKVLSL